MTQLIMNVDDEINIFEDLFELPPEDEHHH